MNNYFKKYMISKDLLSRWWIVSIILSALLVTSCRTTKENTSMSLRDSLEWNRKVSVTLATIPSSLAELTIPEDSLRSLPPHAAYTAKSGQAGLKLTYQNGNVHAVATCDSLQQQVFMLEEELHQARDRLQQQETVKEPPGFTIKCYLTGIITGIISLLIFQYIRRWQKKRKYDP